MQFPVLPLVLMITGGAVAVASFVFAIINMMGRDFDRSFRNHGVAMIGMFIGGLTAVVGGWIGGWSLLSQLIALLTGR